MSDGRTTVSRVLYMGEQMDTERIMLRKACADAANNGGTFSIDNVFDHQWYTVYTINWPDGLAEKAE